MDLLTQLFTKGKATKKFSMGEGDNAFTVELSTLSNLHQVEIDEASRLLEDNITSAGLAHWYIKEVVSRCLISCNGENFISMEAAKDYLGDKPHSFLQVLGKYQNSLEQDVRSLLEPESIDKNFSITNSGSEESKPESVE